MFLCLIILGFMNITKKDGSKVAVTVNGRVYETLSLSKDGTYTIKGANGSYNTFVIKNGYAKMLSASCPDKLCVKEKRIHYNHDTIVCLPNKVVLEVIGGKEDNIDMIAN